MTDKDSVDKKIQLISETLQDQGFEAHTPTSAIPEKDKENLRLIAQRRLRPTNPELHDRLLKKIGADQGYYELYSKMAVEEAKKRLKHSAQRKDDDTRGRGS